MLFTKFWQHHYQRLLSIWFWTRLASVHAVALSGLRCGRMQWNLFSSCQPRNSPNQEPFEFGHGPAQYSHMHAYIPAAVDRTLSTTCLIGTSIINSMNDIPMLGSHGLLSKMRAIIDLPGHVLRLEGMPGSSDVPIVSINGHIAVKITNLPDHVNTCHETWSQLGEMSDHPPQWIQTLEAPGGILFQCWVLPRQSSCASGALGTGSKDLAGVSRCNVDDREEGPAEEGNFRMSTRSDTTIGKQRRQVQQVPHMRKAVERGPRKQPVGRALAKAVATAAFTAFTVLFHGCQLLGPRSLQQSGWAYRQPRHPSCLSYLRKK